jgi:hypothetical protein
VKGSTVCPKCRPWPCVCPDDGTTADIPGDASGTPTDISGDCLLLAREAYRRWFGTAYDLGVLDAVLCCAAAEQLDGDPPWLLVIGGPGAAKTETITPLVNAGALAVSTVSGEAALLSGTPEKERHALATGGLLRLFEKEDQAGLLVIKDVTSILTMNRDTRNAVMSALREIHDGSWSRPVGAEGGRTLFWQGRIVVIGAVTTAWDKAHQVIAAMGDRFLVVRMAPDSRNERRRAGRQAMANTGREAGMRKELGDAVSAVLASITEPGSLSETDSEELLDLADLVTRARTAVERDGQGRPLYAHALEMPTRFAKQLCQLVRGGLAIGMSREDALRVAFRCAGDSVPPLRKKVLGFVAENPHSLTVRVTAGLDLPFTTVDRTLQELHLLSLLSVANEPHGSSFRWAYSIADEDYLPAIKVITRNVRCGQKEKPPPEEEPPPQAEEKALATVEDVLGPVEFVCLHPGCDATFQRRTGRGRPREFCDEHSGPKWSMARARAEARAREGGR